jgi:Thiazole biosynthesis protein ThiG
VLHAKYVLALVSIAVCSLYDCTHTSGCSAQCSLIVSMCCCACLLYRGCLQLCCDVFVVASWYCCLCVSVVTCVYIHSCICHACNLAAVLMQSTNNQHLHHYCYTIIKTQAPYELVKEVQRTGKLPVVNFAAGGVATPADAALMMQLGMDGVFVGSGIFKSHDAAKRAKAIVQAVTHFTDAKVCCCTLLYLYMFVLFVLILICTLLLCCVRAFATCLSISQAAVAVCTCKSIHTAHILLHMYALFIL